MALRGKVGADQRVADHRVNPEGHVQTAGLGGLLQAVEQVGGAEDVREADDLAVLREPLVELEQRQRTIVRRADGRTFVRVARGSGQSLDISDARSPETEHADRTIAVVLGDRRLHGKLIEDRLLLDDAEQLLAEVVLELVGECG